MKTTTLVLVLFALVAVAGCDGSDPGSASDPNLRGDLPAGGATGSAGAGAGASAGSDVGGAAGAAVGAGGAGSTGGVSGAGGMSAAGGAGGSAGACGANTTLCDGSCTDVTVVAHCGSCTNTCGAGQSCTNGQCIGGGAGGSSGGIPFCPPTGAVSKGSSCVGPAHQQLWMKDSDGLPQACVICTSGYDTSVLPCLGAELCVASCSACSP